MKFRVSLRIEEKERYLIHLDPLMTPSKATFVKAICQKFRLKINPKYIVIIEPDIVVHTIDDIKPNARLRLIQENQLPMIRLHTNEIK